MMSNLNSVLIEGVLINEPSQPTENYKISDFTILTVRFYKDEDSVVQREENTFRIETRGRLAEVVSEMLHVGRGVRVVGRITNMGIAAEHIEFKPVYKSPVDTDQVETGPIED